MIDPEQPLPPQQPWNFGHDVARWIPTSDAAKYGIELLGAPLEAKVAAHTLRTALIPNPGEIAFIIISLAESGYNDLHSAVTEIASLQLGVKVCFSIDYHLLPLLNSKLTAFEEVIFMLDITDEGMPLSALTNQAIVALRVGPDLARRLGFDSRGALLLEMLRNLAKEIGLASFGPWLQQGFGVPIKFDYVPEEAVNEVLAKHRLQP